MTYTKMNPQPPYRDEALAYEDLGPGLYADEIAVELDDGNHVAVSITEEWAPNGSGVHLQAWARWIDENGQTHTSPEGAHVESQASVNVGAQVLAEHSMDVLRKEMLLMVLGEPQTLQKIGREDVPILFVADTNRLNWNIRHHIETINQVRKPADLGSILGI